MRNDANFSKKTNLEYTFGAVMVLSPAFLESSEYDTYMSLLAFGIHRAFQLRLRGHAWLLG